MLILMLAPPQRVTLATGLDISIWDPQVFHFHRHTAWKSNCKLPMLNISEFSSDTSSDVPFHGPCVAQGWNTRCGRTSTRVSNYRLSGLALAADFACLEYHARPRRLCKGQRSLWKSRRSSQWHRCKLTQAHACTSGGRTRLSICCVEVHSAF